jgi:hypothetical protein
VPGKGQIKDWIKEPNLCLEKRKIKDWIRAKSGLGKVQVKDRIRANVSLEKDKLKVPKREIFDRSNFPDFYAIKSSWVGDLVVKILTYYFNF